MTRKSLQALRGFAAAFIVIAFGAMAIAAQGPITGEWRASVKEKSPDKIHLSFERRTENGGRNQNGSSYSYSDLQGLSRENAQNGKVSFRLVREAGTIECEGTFVNGSGSGTFTFTPNRGFIEAMRSRGFDFEKKDSGRHDGGIEERLLELRLST